MTLRVCARFISTRSAPEVQQVMQEARGIALHLRDGALKAMSEYN